MSENSVDKGNKLFSRLKLVKLTKQHLQIWNNLIFPFIYLEPLLLLKNKTQPIPFYT